MRTIVRLCLLVAYTGGAAPLSHGSEKPGHPLLLEVFRSGRKWYGS